MESDILLFRMESGVVPFILSSGSGVPPYFAVGALAYFGRSPAAYQREGSTAS